MINCLILYGRVGRRPNLMLPWPGYHGLKLIEAGSLGRCGAGVAFPEAWFWCPQWSQCTHRFCSF